MEQKKVVTVLIVDDDLLYRELIATVVEMADCEVAAQASDGNTAWTLIEEGNIFDVVITDVSMPGGDGISLVQKLHRKYGAAGPVRIYVHSGSQHYCTDNGPLFLPEQIPVLFPSAVFFPKDRNTRWNINEFLSQARE